MDKYEFYKWWKEVQKAVGKEIDVNDDIVYSYDPYGAFEEEMSAKEFAKCLKPYYL